MLWNVMILSDAGNFLAKDEPMTMEEVSYLLLNLDRRVSFLVFPADGPGVDLCSDLVDQVGFSRSPAYTTRPN